MTEQPISLSEMKGLDWMTSKGPSSSDIPLDVSSLPPPQPPSVSLIPAPLPDRAGWFGEGSLCRGMCSLESRPANQLSWKPRDWEKSAPSAVAGSGLPGPNCPLTLQGIWNSNGQGEGQVPSSPETPPHPLLNLAGPSPQNSCYLACNYNPG